MALTPVWAHARDFHFLGEFDEGVDRAWIFHLNAVEFDIGSSRGEWEMDVFSVEYSIDIVWGDDATRRRTNDFARFDEHRFDIVASADLIERFGSIDGDIA